MTSETRPKPSVWRFIAWQVNFREKTAKTFWDGRLASTRQLSEIKTFMSFENVSETPRPFPNFDPSILSSMFLGTKFYLDTYSETIDEYGHHWGDNVGKSKNLIKSKIAQLRVYPTALNEVQLQHIQTRSLWDSQRQDPAVNHLTSRGPQNATFAEATAACAQGKTIVTAVSREATLNLLERAGSDLQSLSWVGALNDEGCTSKWKWSGAAAPDGCLMDKDSFWEGDFTCFYNETGLSLADAQQQCQNRGRILKVPRNEEYATLSRIKLSCPDLARNHIPHKCLASEVCLSQRHTVRKDTARDIYVDCPEGFEARVDDSDNDDLYANFMCCPPSPTCSGPPALHRTYFCQGASSYHADPTDMCLAVLKFQGELQYISINCSEPLSYICQDAPTSSMPTTEIDMAGDMKECFDESDLESNSFVDTLQQDVQGHTCSFYAKMSTSHPQVCDSSAAKTMCPVTERERLF